jgi:hypothetical protein
MDCHGVWQNRHTVFVLTWNSGNEGDADGRAAAARIIPLHLGAPSAKMQEGCIDAFFAQFGLSPMTSRGGGQRNALPGTPVPVIYDGYWTQLS